LSTFCLFILYLYYSGMPGILEKILDCIDYKNLNKVQQVSKVWNETVKMGFSWRRQLQKMVYLKLINFSGKNIFWTITNFHYVFRYQLILFGRKSTINYQQTMELSLMNLLSVLIKINIAQYSQLPRWILFRQYL